MAGLNKMTKLLNKAERRLGLTVINLPDNLKKETWAEIVKEDTIPTFSRYFPFRHRVIIDHKCEKDGFFFVDRDLPEGVEIIGVKDIAWDAYRADPRMSNQGLNYGNWDFIAGEYGVADIAMTQMRADYVSLFNLGIYIEEYPPNKIKLVSVNGSTVSRYNPFPVDVYVNQPENLMGISPTMMETFEELAFSDIASALYQNLKYYDGTDTVYSTLDLKLDTLQEWANKRENIVNKLDEAHVTTANEHQHMIMCI